MTKQQLIESGKLQPIIVSEGEVKIGKWLLQTSDSNYRVISNDIELEQILSEVQ
jgi:hypothetical protein